MEWLIGIFSGLCALGAAAFITVLKYKKAKGSRFPPPPTDADMR